MPDRELATERAVPAVERGPLGEVAWVALKLGFTAFGGPAGHSAMLREEVVVRRRWLSDQHFLDLIGATNLIPGPNSTERVIHLSARRSGAWRARPCGALSWRRWAWPH